MIKYYYINILIFVVTGALEAFIWHYHVNRISKVTAKRLHYPLVVFRVLWFAYFWKISDHDYSSTMNLMLCYPMWHLGTMYQVRHWLNNKIYKNGFIDVASATSTSLFDKYFNLDFIARFIMFIFGTTFYFIWNL